MNSAPQPPDGHTIRNERRDFPQWHLGRSHYALWALPVDTAAVRQRLQAAQGHLAPWLLPDYCRQPHITLGLCGFLGLTPAHDDDFGADALRLQLQALRRARPQAFDISIGGLASFSTVPYLSVQAPAPALATLRQCVANSAMNSSEQDYIPHVTVGLYADVWPLAQLHAQFQHFTETDALPLRIHSIALLSYEAREIGGPLQTLAEYDFAEGRLRWSGALPAPLQALAGIA